MTQNHDLQSAIAQLPWSAEAEYSVLGALLIDNAAFDRVGSLLRRQDFFDSRHGDIWDAVSRLLLARKPADVITVFDELGPAKAEEIGGLQYLNAIAQSVPSAANVARYTEIVADKALRRRLLATVDEARELLHQAKTADEALDQVQARLAGVKRLNCSGDPRALGDLMAARIGLWERLQSGEDLPGDPTGLPRLDEALGGGIKPGKVIVLAARPSVGKTSLATQILLHVASQGTPALMLSQEMSAGELMDRAAAHLGAIRMDRLSSGRLDAEDWSRVAEVADRAAKLPVFIDDHPALTLLDMRAKARQVKRQAGGLGLLVVDYLQLCSGAGPTDKRHHQIEQISRGVKTLAKELGVCVLLLSQLNRASASEGAEPELQHLKESGAIEEDADVVLLLHPMGQEADGSLLVQAKVAKNRGGRRGRLALAFDGRTQRWAPSNGNVSRRGAS